MYDTTILLDDAITTIMNIITDSCLLMELDKDKGNKLKATIKVCAKTCLLLLQQVFNKQYYPLMDDESEKELLELFIVYCVLNVVYPYTKDGPVLHKLINSYHNKIQDYCVEHCLLYILHETTELYNMLIYLTELCYNIF